MRRHVPSPSEEETERAEAERADAITEVDLPIATPPDRFCICRQTQTGSLIVTAGCIVHDPTTAA